jgi:hypothetical protein
LRRSNIPSANSCPFRIKPAFGKVGENGIEPPPPEGRNIFDEGELRSDVPNDLEHFNPET